MKQRHVSKATHGICAITLIISSVILTIPNAYSETYLAGQLGAAVPVGGGALESGGGLTSVDVNSSFFLSGTTHSDLELSSSFMFGGKVGHYFDSVRWFGLEAEVFHTTPHIEQQRHTFQNPAFPGVTPTANLQGAYLRVLTVAPFNLMFRYPPTAVYRRGARNIFRSD